MVWIPYFSSSEMRGIIEETQKGTLIVYEESTILSTASLQMALEIDFA
jgi:hypothetical protein